MGSFKQNHKLKTVFRFSKTETQSKMQPNSHFLLTCYSSTYNHYNFKYIDSLDTYMYKYNLDVYWILVQNSNLNLVP